MWDDRSWLAGDRPGELECGPVDKDVLVSASGRRIVLALSTAVCLRFWRGYPGILVGLLLPHAM